MLIALIVPTFSKRMLPEVQQAMWEAYSAGEGASAAARVSGVDRTTVGHRVKEAGGIRPRRGRDLQGRCLSLEERVQIVCGLAVGSSIRLIATGLGRAASTVSREIVRNTCDGQAYSATRAHARAWVQGSRPQPGKLETNPALRARVVTDLNKKDSPEQIAGRLAKELPHDAEMNVSHETIYRFIYLQPRGSLKREVASALRSGRIIRKPRRKTGQRAQGRIANMISISERPDVDDLDGDRIPGHWEGDLIIGKNNASAIGTVVERATGYLMLLHLPHGRSAELVAAALTARLVELPASLRESLTWDQGKELSDHAQVSVDAGINIYFADPHAPWQRPSNENTNGLLRQYFPKGTDLAAFNAEDLAWVEQEMNDRPRARLQFAKPQELMTQLLLR